MRDALTAVAVAALLVLAGCSGASGPTETTTETTTVEPTTDAPTTTTETTTAATTTGAEQSAYPPGVTSDGVENATALVESHRASVVEDGAEMELTQRINASLNGQPLTIDGRETARLTPGASELRWTVVANTTRGNETTQLNERYYANESTLFSRVDHNDNVTIRSRNRSSFWNRAILGAPSKARIVNATLTAVNFTVANVSDQDGQTVTTLVANNQTGSGSRSATVYDATLTVTESGRVLSMTRSRTVDTDGATSRYEVEITWSSATDVERPEWTGDAEAVNATQ